MNIYEKAKVEEETDTPKTEAIRTAGWFVSGPDTHAMIIGRAIITMKHDYNEEGICKYCRHNQATELNIR